MVVWLVPKLMTEVLEIWDCFGAVSGMISNRYWSICVVCVLNCDWSVWAEMAVSFRSSGVGPNAGIFVQFRTAHTLFLDC